MIDWLSLRLDAQNCPDWGGWRRLAYWGDRIMRYCPASGAIVWESAAWDSVRSDSHQLALKASAGSLFVQGSPARVMGDGDTVFGSAVGGRDICRCAETMIAFASRLLHVSPVPSLRLWACSRADVTQNFLIEGLGAAGVRVALSELRSIEGGRYRVSQQAGDTVYWSHLSRHRAGKAYAKGPHLRYLMKKDTYTGRLYDDSELSLADLLLRLELRLGSKFFFNLREQGIPWYNLTWSDLQAQHDEYFERMLGVEGVEGVGMQFVEQCVRVAPSEGQGKAAARTWSVIQSMGWQAARDSMPLRTWYRHLKILKAAGLGDADISAGRVVSLRRPLLIRPVVSWSDLHQVAAGLQAVSRSGVPSSVVVPFQRAA
jgi:hypothetical protein